MTTKTVKEVESPILEFDRNTGDYFNKKDQYLWCCAEKLTRLFDIDPYKAKSIVFFAKAKADRSTYRARLNEFGSMLKPVDAMLYDSLSEWLQQQIKAGRPNIGVRIIQ